MSEDKPIMHFQRELEEDLKHEGILPNETLFKWFNDRYSTSKHLLTLYSIARGLNSKKILEIGFGRSTFVLAKAAYENGGELISCDNRDFSYLLSEKERGIVKYVYGNSDKVWNSLNEGIDFAFLDYFSSEKISEKFCITEIKKCIPFMRTNGIITFHDSIIDRYDISKVLKKFAKRKDIELVSLPYNYGLAIVRFIGKSKYGIIEDNFIKKPEN